VVELRKSVEPRSVTVENAALPDGLGAYQLFHQRTLVHLGKTATPSMRGGLRQ
jgi:hypothetical protein